MGVGVGARSRSRPRSRREVLRGPEVEEDGGVEEGEDSADSRSRATRRSTLSFSAAASRLSLVLLSSSPNNSSCVGERKPDTRKRVEVVVILRSCV